MVHSVADPDGHRTWQRCRSCTRMLRDACAAREWRGRPSGTRSSGASRAHASTAEQPVCTESASNQVMLALLGDLPRPAPVADWSGGKKSTDTEPSVQSCKSEVTGRIVCCVLSSLTHTFLGAA